MFQFTHPVRGATAALLPRPTRNGVSIHAPRAGCDRRGIYQLRRRRCFNSRTPCGVRRRPIRQRRHRARVSIHAPRAGCDHAARKAEDSRRPVSIHAPRAGCDQVCRASKAISQNVSIHAPRAGCDALYHPLAGVYPCFNSRTPCGVRRKPLPRDFWRAAVSIHAPRAGCDTTSVML